MTESKMKLLFIIVIHMPRQSASAMDNASFPAVPGFFSDVSRNLPCPKGRGKNTSHISLFLRYTDRAFPVHDRERCFVADSFDIQRAGLLKRFSAFLLDFIVITILATFFIFLISKITNFDYYNTQLTSSYEKYEREYGVTFSISSDEYYSYTPEERGRYDEAYGVLIGDGEAMANYQRVMNLTLLSLSLGIFLAVFTSEFLIPLFFKNGVTIGKKIFGLCLMRRGGWKVNSLSLFIRSVLGKYTIEIMIPVLLIVMILFNVIGIVGTAVIVALTLTNFLLVMTRREHQAIHDILADTVVVDYASQKIYDSEEDVIEAKKERAREEAERSGYY